MSRLFPLFVVLSVLLAASSLLAQDLAPQPGVTATAAVLCVPGAQQACACGGGVQGYQACARDGMSFSPCVCAVVDQSALLGASPAAPALGAPDDSALRQPVRFTERPLTLPRLTLRPTLRVEVWKGLYDASRARFSPSLLSFSEVFQLVLGAQLGVTDDFELSAEVLPVQLAPRGAFGDMRLALSYRFARGGFDAAVAATLDLATGAQSTSTLRLGIPMRWRGSASRTDLTIELVTPLAGRFMLGLNLPLMVQFAFSERAHMGFTTGLSMVWTPGRSDFERSFALPLGIAGGFTVRGPRGPVVDVDPYLQFPSFLNTARGKVEASLEEFVVGLNASVYLYL